jgi:hypothetical protein
MHQLFAPAFGSWQSKFHGDPKTKRKHNSDWAPCKKCCTLCCSIYAAMQYKASLLDLAHFKLKRNNFNSLKGIRLLDEMAMLQFMLQQMLQHNARHQS